MENSKLKRERKRMYKAARSCNAFDILVWLVPFVAVARGQACPSSMPATVTLTVLVLGENADCPSR